MEVEGIRVLPPWAIANAVTSFATILAGVFTLLLWRVVPGQPRRWAHAYAWIFLTGIPTLGLHGYGEPFQAPSHPYWAVADTGSNLILVWAVQVAVLGDFYRRQTQWRVGLASLLINFAAIGQMIAERFFYAERSFLIPLGSAGGFYAGEAMLIADSIFVTGLLYANRKRVIAQAYPLLHVIAATFIVGMLLATARNEEILGLAGEGVGTFHGLWHIVSAFGFFVLFLFNHIRFARES